MRDVHNAEAGLLAFVRQIENAPAVGPLLQRQTFPAVAVSVEIVVAD